MSVSLFDRLKVYTPMLCDKGREDLAGVIHAWRDAYGAKWFEAYKAANPSMTFVVDLAANYEFPEAFEKLKEEADAWVDAGPNVTIADKAKRVGLRATAKAILSEYRPELEKLHAFIRSEIHKPVL